MHPKNKVWTFIHSFKYMNYLKLRGRDIQEVSASKDKLRGSRVKSKLPALTIPTPPLIVHCRQKGFLSEWKEATTGNIQTPEERTQATSG